MKNRDFYNLADAKRFLEKGVIQLEKRPIYVLSILAGKNKKSKFVMKYRELGVGKAEEEKTSTLSNPKLDMTPVPLGWLSVTDKSKMAGVYLTRQPRRMQRIGFCQENTTMHTNHVVHKKRVPQVTAMFYTSKELRNTILGRYPTVEHAIEWGKTGEIYPFSRNFAIANDKLFYRYFPTPVGVVMEGKLCLHDTSGPLKELLKEDLDR